MENKLTREEFMNKLIAYTKELIPGYQGGAEWYDYDVKQQMWGTLYVICFSTYSILSPTHINPCAPSPYPAMPRLVAPCQVVDQRMLG